MNARVKSVLSPILQGFGGLCFLLAGLLFWFGGRAIHELLGVDRVLAEVIGLGTAAILGLLGFVCKTVQEDFVNIQQADDGSYTASKDVTGK